MPYKTPEAQRARNREYYQEHKAEINAWNRDYWQKNKEHLLAKNKEYRNAHKDELAQKSKEKRLNHPEIERRKHHDYYLKHKAEIQAKRKEYNKTHKRQKRIYNVNYYETKKVILKEQSTKYRTAIKTEVLTHYGNGKCECVRCGYSDIRALTIDHMKGNGGEHRKQIGRAGGIVFYIWLKHNNYPTDYQTYCCNCQSIKKTEQKEYRKDYRRKYPRANAVVA